MYVERARLGLGPLIRAETLEPLIHGEMQADTADVLANLLSAFAQTPVVWALFDETDRLRASNEAFRTAYFADLAECRTWADIMRDNFHAERGVIVESTTDIECWLSSVGSRRGQEGHRSFESDLHDGRWLQIHELALSNGWILVFGSDVTALNASNREVRADRDTALNASRTDELTQVSNRRHIMSRLEAATEAAPANSDACGAVGLIDIDYFKAINDTHGHQAGDEVLIQLARLVRADVRVGDAFGRVGGEEFLLIMAGATKAQSRDTLERLMTRIRALRPLEDHPEVAVSVSIGVTDLRPNDTPNSVFQRCDAALYRAKEDGRDRIVEDFSGQG